MRVLRPPSASVVNSFNFLNYWILNSYKLILDYNNLIVLPHNKIPITSTNSASNHKLIQQSYIPNSNIFNLTLILNLVLSSFLSIFLDFDWLRIYHSKITKYLFKGMSKKFIISQWNVILFTLTLHSCPQFRNFWLQR